MINVVEIPELSKPVFQVLNNQALRIGDRVLDPSNNTAMLIESQDSLDIAISGGFVLLIPFIPPHK